MSKDTVGWLASDVDEGKALETAMFEINRDLGKGTVVIQGDNPLPKLKFFPTSAIPLNLGLGTGGLPLGAIVSLLGPYGTGKTTIALDAIANAQKRGGRCAIIDMEHRLNIEYARALGVDVDALIISRPKTGQDALKIADRLLRSGALDVLLIDSTAALVPEAEMNGNMGDSFAGLHDKLMSQALCKINPWLVSGETCVIFLSQIYEKPGVQYGSPEENTGGDALKHYASLILDVRVIEHLKEGDDCYGIRVRVKIIKNTYSPPSKVVEFDILYGTGICRESALLDIGVAQTVVRKAGAWYTYNGDPLGEGKVNARRFLEEHPDVADEIEKMIYEKLGIVQAPAEDARDESSTSDEVTGKGLGGGILETAVSQGIVRCDGGWYTYKGEKIGHGKKKAREFLEENPDLAGEIEEKVHEKLVQNASPSGDESGQNMVNGHQPSPAPLPVS